MLHNKIFTKVLLLLMILTCIFGIVGCGEKESPKVNDSVIQDTINNRIQYDKKYYYLGYDGYSKNEYYIFKADGTASYNTTLKDGNTVTFQQQINFKWTYAGEGNCIIIHNGTKILNGTQDDAFGISRIMHVAKDVIYWSADGQDTFFVCEDFVNKIPNYGKFI